MGVEKDRMKEEKETGKEDHCLEETAPRKQKEILCKCFMAENLTRT